MTTTVPVSPPVITALPDGPKSTDPLDEFRQKAYARVDAEQAMVPELNAANEATYQNAVSASQSASASAASAATSTQEADRSRDEGILALGYRNQAGGHATTATQQAGIAATKAGEAAASAGGASTSAGLAAQAQAAAEEQVGLAAAQAVRAEDAAASIADGPVTRVNGKTGDVQLSAEDIAALATTAEMQVGSQTSPRSLSPHLVKQAVLAHAPKSIERAARTANTQLITTDSGKWIDITAGTFTQTFLAPAALGAGWWCYLQNSGTGDITIPSSDGRTNWIMYPNEVRLFQCDGAALRSIVLVGFRRTFTSSDSLIRPPGYKEVLGIGWDGGQGGGVNGYGNPVQGGVGASLKEYRVGPENTKTELAIVIGSGGLGSTDINTGGKYPGGITTLDGQIGVLSSRSDAALYKAGNGGDSNYGGATAKPGFTSTYAGRGGDGGYGVLVGTMTNGQPGNAPGGGGGGANDNGYAPRSGDGARGELRTWGVK